MKETEIHIEEVASDRFDVIVNGGQQGIYKTVERAKASCRKFLHSSEGIKWNGLKAQIVPKRQRRREY